MNDLERWFDQVAALPELQHVHHLYAPATPEGRVRLANLRQYFVHTLMHQPDVLLVGEAPGYQGAYRTGIPFCSEYIMLGPVNAFGAFGGPANGYQRVYSGDKVWKEPSATIVQRTIQLLPRPPLIWATFPLHPHQPGNDLSNRAPTATEIQLGSQVLQGLIRVVQPRQVVAVGNIASQCLSRLDMPHQKVRHPSHGGATQFHMQLLTVMGAGVT